MKILITLICILFSTGIAYSQKTYNLKHMEVYKGNALVSKGQINGDKLVVNESLGKITQVTPEAYKDQIFRIVERLEKKVKDPNEIVYACELKNRNGTVSILIKIDTFYQTIEYHSTHDIENSTGNYLKQYYE